MDLRDFLEGQDGSSWQMLDALDAFDRAFIRVDSAGRIIAQTDRAEELVGQVPLRSVYEVLGELAVRTIRIAIARREMMRTRDVIDGRVVSITACPGQGSHLLYFEPEAKDGPLLRDQIIEQRLRTALSVLALDDPAARHRSVMHMCRLLHEVELLDGRPLLRSAMQRCDLRMLCADVVRFTARCTQIPIACEGGQLPVVCQPDAISMALYHLLTNAVLAPGVTRITVRWGKTDGYVWFEAADDGAVLSEEAFQALCTASARVGTRNGMPPVIEGHTPGLGLPAVCEIAMRHGGGVSVADAAEGKAVRVTFAADLPEDPAMLRTSAMMEDGYALEETELSVLM